MSRRDAELLAKGDRLLESLKLRAEAARAASEQSQLQLLLDRARVGEAAPLKAWLDAQEPADARRDAPVQLGQDVEGKSAERIAASKSLGWDSAEGKALLAASLMRLGLESQSREAAPKAEPATLPAVDAKDGGSSKREARPGKSKPATAKSDPQKPKRQEPVARRTKANQQVLQAVANVLGDQQLQPASQQKSRLAGVIASILAHVLLLVVLAVITLKLPADSAGLALESASVDAAEPAVEIVQEVESELPDAAEASDASQPVIDASDSLSEIQTNASEAIEQISTKMPGSSATSVMSATAAASSGMPSDAAASFFGAAVGGNNFCYVIDASGSMRGGPWRAAKFELLKSLASMKPNQRYYIICFNRTLSPMTLDGIEPEPSSVYATPENIQKTRQWLETIEIGIGAPPNKALEYAIELEPDAIYLLSDGVTKVDVAEFLRETNQVESLFGDTQIRVPIHPIAYYSLEGQTLLRQIAAENKGQFIYVPDPTK